MLGVGLVDFDTAAGDDFDFKFTGINDPAGARAPDRRAAAGRAAGALAAGTADSRASDTCTRGPPLRAPTPRRRCPSRRGSTGASRAATRAELAVDARRGGAAEPERGDGVAAVDDRHGERGRRGVVGRGARSTGPITIWRSSTNAIALQGAPTPSCTAASDGAQDVVGLLAAVDDRLHASRRCSRAAPRTPRRRRACPSGTGVRLARGAVDQHHHLLGVREQRRRTRSGARPSPSATTCGRSPAVRMKTSISSSKRAGASYSHAACRITNSRPARERVQQLRGGAGTRRGRGRSTGSSGRSRRPPGRRSRRSRRA